MIQKNCLLLFSPAYKPKPSPWLFSYFSYHWRLSLCCLFPWLVTFPFSFSACGFKSAALVQAQILEFEWLADVLFKRWGYSAWSRRFIQLWKSCLAHRLVTENWSGTILKFRAVILSLLLYYMSIFNCWWLILLFTWVLQILFRLVYTNLACFSENILNRYLFRCISANNYFLCLMIVKGSYCGS